MWNKSTLLNGNDNAEIRLSNVLVLLLAWILGLAVTYGCGAVFPDSFAFISSLCGTVAAVFVLWYYFIRQLDRTISLSSVLIIFFIKAIFIYIIWTTYVFAPLGMADLELTHELYFNESYHYWMQIHELASWWASGEYNIVNIRDSLNINHPEAMALVALPFLGLPLFSEVLIPWNMLYSTVAACAVYGIGVLEGFKKSVCRAAFFLVLLQPFAWNVWGPLKRDAQCQMFFGVFLLGVLFFRKKSLPLIITSVIAIIILSLYRTIYGPVFFLTVLYIFVLHGSRVASKITIRVFVVFALGFLLLVCSSTVNNLIHQYVFELFDFYSVGDQESLSLIVYQERLSGHSSWIASIPQRLILGLMSPFPWTDISNVKNPFEFFWYLANYLTAAIGLVCFGAISIFGFLDIRKKIFPPVSVVFVMLVAITGMGGSSVHSLYVQIGLFLSFPYVWSKLGKKGVIKYFLFSVGFFVLTSVLWSAIR